jgi:aldehyde dehydrogenase (NAD+)
MASDALERSTLSDSARLLAGLRGVFNTGRTRDLQWRLKQLRGIERLVEEGEAELAAALAEDLGRSAFDSWLGEVASTKAEAAYARKRLKRWMRSRRAALPLVQIPGRAWTQYEPLGAVLVIGPWNYPVYLSLSPLVAAVAAGNCAVVKPSELAPATSAVIARLVPQYLAPDAVKVVEGGADTTQELLAAGFDHALFTGGTEVGRKIMAAAAPTLTPVTLELGGKSPVIVVDDADLDVTARRIAFAKLVNSGQTCIAPDYVLADRKIAKQLVDKIVNTITEFRSVEKDPSQRIVNQRQFDRLVSLVSSTEGKVVLGGGSDASTLRMEPTVIIDPSPTDPVMVNEIFGPILPVLTVDSPNAAIEFINSRPKPLAMYVFTSSPKLGRDIVNRVPAGGAVINHVAMHVLVPSLPFGGVGPSGMGAYHGKAGFEAMSHRKSVLSRPAKFDPQLIYPPYSDRTLKILRRLF